MFQNISLSSANTPGVLLDTKFGQVVIEEKATIKTEGTNSPGIIVLGDGVRIDFAGFMETNGASAPGILVAGNNVTIVCRPGATIVATGGSVPIDVMGNNTTLNGCIF